MKPGTNASAGQTHRAPGIRLPQGNGRHYRMFEHIPIKFPAETAHLLDAGEIELLAGENKIGFDSGVIRATWSDGTQAEWKMSSLRTGLRIWKDFFSWDGTNRTRKLPAHWGDVPRATLYPLTPDGRGPGVPIAIEDRTVMPSLLPQVPYIFVPETQSKENRR